MIGQTISHYQILEKLGEGGMGVVYKAEDTKLHRPVALKFLPFDLTRDAEAKSRFTREAQAASALDHPSIAVVHEIDEASDGRSFICMAYYDGETLSAKIKRGPLSVEEAIRIAIQVTEGLERAHGAGIVHRDIKPANIIVTKRNEVKILDFGIAKLTGQTLLTRTGHTAGTAAYMSPEQVQGGRTDHRSDLFSLGVVLYEMVTGTRPFSAEHEAALFYSILNLDPPSPSTARRDLPKELEAVIRKLLEKNSDQRYQHASEVRADLKRILGEDNTPKRPTRGTGVFNLRRTLVPALLVIAIVLALLPPVRTAFQSLLGVESMSVAKHLAVIPFTNVGDDPMMQAFCSGLVERVASKLTLLKLSEGSFWVVAASEMRDRKVTSAAQAQKEFGVTLAVTGSVQREKDQVQLTVNLVETKSGRQLKASVLARRTGALSGLEDEVVNTVSAMLGVQLNPRANELLAAGATSEPQAHDFYLQARGYLQGYQKPENINIAISLFDRALREDSSYALALAGRGEAYWRKYDAMKEARWIDSATVDCSRALELDDQLSAAHTTLGLIYTGTGRYENALTEFQRAIAIYPLNADAYREMARAFENLNRIHEAEETYKKAVELNPTYWAGYNNLGRFYFSRGRYEEAAAQFKHITDLTPDNFQGYTNLGGAYFHLNRWNDAQEMYERSLQIEPNYVAYAQLGTLHFYEGRYRESAQMYDEALKKNNSNYKVWGFLGAAYHWVAGEDQKEKMAFTRAAEMAEAQLKVNPLNVEAMSLLAGYQGMLGETTKARSLLRKALSLAPDDVDLLARAGEIYEQLGDREEALRLIGIALRSGYPSDKIGRDPGMKKLRADSRFKKIQEGLSKGG